MNQADLNQFLLGGCVVACFVAGLFFLRFYRRTHDRLFAIFAVAFAILGINWAALAFTQADEVRTFFYVLRLSAFCLIIFAILDKNRARAA